jgi:hypothetical protein
MDYQRPAVHDADAGGNEVPTPAAAANSGDAPPAQPALHTVTFRDQSGAQTQFRMKAHTKLGKAKVRPRLVAAAHDSGRRS